MIITIHIGADFLSDTTVITLADWYHVAAKLGSAFPTADTTLINGLGRFAGGPTSDLAVITVEAGKRSVHSLVPKK